MLNNDMVKEQIQKYGAENIYDIELISVLIGNKVAKILLENNITTINNLISKKDNELLSIDGISTNTLYKIRAMCTLVSRRVKEEADSPITKPRTVYNLCRDMEEFDQEVIRLFCLNTKSRPTFIKDVFKGGVDVSILDVTVLMKEAVTHCPKSIVVCHNHPSGDPSPSKEDINITHRIKSCCDILGITFADHVVIGHNSYISLKEKGVF